jgi:hypothetical protein
MKVILKNRYLEKPNKKPSKSIGRLIILVNFLYNHSERRRFSFIT